jgi:hypothetical protein
MPLLKHLITMLSLLYGFLRLGFLPFLNHHNIYLHEYNDFKIRETQLHKMHEQNKWVVWCLHLLHEVLEIWHLLRSNWRHLMPWITILHPPLVAILNWCRKNVLQRHHRIENIKRSLWIDTMGQTPTEGFVMKRN